MYSGSPRGLSLVHAECPCLFTCTLCKQFVHMDDMPFLTLYVIKCGRDSCHIFLCSIRHCSANGRRSKSFTVSSKSSSNVVFQGAEAFWSWQNYVQTNGQNAKNKAKTENQKHMTQQHQDPSYGTKRSSKAELCPDVQKEKREDKFVSFCQAIFLARFKTKCI